MRRQSSIAKILRTTSVLGLLASANSFGEGYGIFEARGLAMGGATVAIGNTDNGLFYNPALMAFHDGDEDNTRDGSFYFPVVTAQISESSLDMFDIEDDELDERVTDSVQSYNDDQSTENARSVVSAAQDLLSAVDNLDDQDIFGEGFVGMSLTVPGDRQGAGFYMGGRVLGAGRANIVDSDQALLADYVEGLDIVASGGDPADIPPGLFNGDGTLIDPIDQIDSSAAARGLGIFEWGIAVGKEVDIFGVPVAFGATPKLMVIKVYEANQDIQGGNITDSDSADQYQIFNADLGMAVEFAQYFRAGIAVKDVHKREFQSDQGGEAVLSPKSRFGLGFTSSRVQLGLDVDLNPIEPVGEENEIQEVALGGEWKINRRVALRGGYRHDLNAAREDILSAGIGLQWGGFLMDVAYADGDTSRGVSLQLGFRH